MSKEYYLLNKTLSDSNNVGDGESLTIIDFVVGNDLFLLTKNDKCCLDSIIYNV